ncbi:MgtC/SapB family protein [Shouchella lonarensis]|uniref:Putative Mg2+ transporter-C (MgtC) family protein n=1 Tax=Shouchella lonarensis TaxID=1464122 RepID=A0A1G6I0W7_9BACI|nr:MgtC/SapB family protein [Shouchella lonarensis]SDC00172.1 putative Mg2+ transporter-C (MgtC) family protein [Shouchella lonarensis]
MDVILLKLSAALFSGFLIGVDRQIKHKPLGLKTSMVICIASCLITIVSVEAYLHFSTNGSSQNMDPMRLAAQIVSGVGFLGAGVILRRSNDVISGLTTAAMIWAASGIGIAIGANFYKEAFLTVVLILVSVNVIPALIKLIGPMSLSQTDVALRVVMEKGALTTHLIKRLHYRGKTWKERRTNSMIVREVKIKDLEDGCKQLDISVSIPRTMYITSVYDLVKEIDMVQKVSVEQR